VLFFLIERMGSKAEEFGSGRKGFFGEAEAFHPGACPFPEGAGVFFLPEGHCFQSETLSPTGEALFLAVEAFGLQRKTFFR